MRIIEATILSLDEYVKYQHLISDIKAKWWLRTPVDKDRTYFVDYDCGVNAENFAETKNLYIRPVLRISDHNYKLGSIVVLFNLQWIVLDYDLAICAFARKAEDCFSNIDWENCNLKKWLDNWLNNILYRHTLLVNIKNETEYMFLNSFCKKYSLPALDFSFKNLEFVYDVNNVCFVYPMHEDWKACSLLANENNIVVSFAEFCNIILCQKERAMERLKKVYKK